MKKEFKTIKKNNKVLENCTKIFLLIILILSISIEVNAQRDFKKEEKIGQKLSEKIEKQYTLIENSETLNRLNKIGEHLKNTSDMKEIQYQFKVIDKEGPNAFAFPGGFIYLTADIFDYIQSDDELAAVIAHEMGHIIHQHSIKQMLDNKKLRLVEFFTILLTGDPTLGLLSELASITLLNSYRREYEREADLAALELLNRSSLYHPVALLTYFERVSSENMLKPVHDLGIFQTHPDVKERIGSIQKYLLENGIEIDRRITTNYLRVDRKLLKDNHFMVVQIFINEKDIFCFTGIEEEKLYQKMVETVSNLDRSLKLDLEPYEINIYSDEKKSVLWIGSEKIISLSREEVDFQNCSPFQVLKKAKEKISQILWDLKLKLPILLVED